MTGQRKRPPRDSATADERKWGWAAGCCCDRAGSRLRWMSPRYAIGKTRRIERINKALGFIAERESQQ